MSAFDSSTLTGAAAALYNQQSIRQSVANTALNRGVTLLQQGKYEKAVVEFKRAAAFDPQSETTYTLLGKTYEILEKHGDAVTAFKKAIQIAPDDADARANLGEAYVKANDYTAAAEQYRSAIRLDPAAPQQHYSLGFVYMLAEKYSDAEGEFKKVIQLAPGDSSGYHALGNAYSKQGHYAEAIGQFEHALSLDKGLSQARADMAFAYIGLGQTAQAEEQAQTLALENTTEAYSLVAQIEAALYTPKIKAAATGDSTFNPYLVANAPLYVLDSSLATPGASKEFTMVFQFNQDMDVASVQNVLNWSIAKSQGGTGGVYDNGYVADAQREVGIMPLPLSVSYDPVTRKATVRFRLTQNGNGDGILDPAHWVFRFFGKDKSGHAMDPTGDQWDGFAGKSF